MNYSERGSRLYECWAFLEKYYLLIDVVISRFRKQAIHRLNLNDGATVADIGCGHGRSLKQLCSVVGRSGTVLGFDYSSGMAKRSKARYEGHPVISVARADARRLPLQSESLDGALSSYALSTIPHPKLAIKSIYDALKPNGRLAVVDYNCPQGLRYHLVKYPRKISYNWQGTDIVELLDEVFTNLYVSKRDFGSVVIVIAEK